MNKLLFLLGAFLLIGFVSGQSAIPPLFQPQISTDSSVFINVSGSVPVIEDLEQNILVCENQTLSSFFNVTEFDQDPLNIGITPSNPFFVTPTSTLGGQTKIDVEIFSALLDKSDLGLHEETVFASDGNFIATEQTNITVIEINNPPDLTDIGVHTVWTSGLDSNFYEQVLVSDLEDGDQFSGNLTFSLDFFSSSVLFGINQTGAINYTPNAADIGVYEIGVCVTDQGLSVPHSQILIECGQDGGPIETCKNFSLTVTDSNRAPNITSNFPVNLTFSVGAGVNIEFNISDLDADGTIPDTYWLVDGTIAEYDPASTVDEFTHSFACGTAGQHTVVAESTDGLLNTTVQWNISVAFVECPPGIFVGGGGGGGGGGGTRCEEKWGCGDWEVCQDVHESFEIGIVEAERFDAVTESCFVSGFVNNCGIQIRECEDANSCGTTFFDPPTSEECFFLEEPSCSDGVLNCHSGSCELLTDCGGPCKACPTCSDGVRNQGEERIDCGGPCPFDCPIEIPIYEKIRIQYVLIGVILILLILVISLIIRIVLAKKKVREDEE